MESTRLLKMLEPAVRPGAAPSAPGATRTPFEHQRFDDLLALVSSGAVRSDRAVSINDAADLTAPFEPEQLERLAAAADVAEAAGAGRAVMLVDGRAVIMDVVERAVTSELAADGSAEPARVAPVDAAVLVGGGEVDPAATPSIGRRGIVPPPAAGVLPASIAEQLDSARRLPHSTPE